MLFMTSDSNNLNARWFAYQEEWGNLTAAQLYAMKPLSSDLR